MFLFHCQVFPISPSKLELVLTPSLALNPSLPRPALLPAQWAHLMEKQPFQTTFVSADPHKLHTLVQYERCGDVQSDRAEIICFGSSPSLDPLL